MYWIQLIIIIIFVIIMVPIEKRVNRSVSKKWLAWVITFAIGIIIAFSFVLVYKYLI